MLVLADTFYSGFFVNWEGMFPEKYRSDDSRRKGNVWKLVLAIISVIVGTLIPPQIYEYDVVESYSSMAAVSSIRDLIILLGLPLAPSRTHG